jgi:ubiquinone/menaquinone biosynthesis C-methylase UbiE
MALALLPTIFRELVVPRTLPREPEPALVMSDPAEVAAYVEAGRTDGTMAASYLFHTARISQVIRGCTNVLDLCCGPATQLAQVAALHPQISFTGIDLSATMLAAAAHHVRDLQLDNVTLREGDASRLAGVPDGSFDGVMSTLALHHLPSLEHLGACFAEIRRVLRPGGALYLADFSRLKSDRSVRFFASRNARHQPPLFSLEYEQSLRAAFLEDDFVQLTSRHFAADARVTSTFKVPFLVVVKSKDRALAGELRQIFAERRAALAPRYRTDLDDLRTFFRLGGLRDDPFAA